MPCSSTVITCSTARLVRALEYLLHKRKLTLPTIEAWGLGYAPSGYETAPGGHFTERGYSEQDLTDTGLVSAHRRTGRVAPRSDRFRHRILIPIRR